MGIVCRADVTFLLIRKITGVTKSTRWHAEEIVATHYLLQTAVFNVSVSPLNQITNVSQLSNAQWLHSAGQPNICLAHETTKAHVLSSVFFPHAMIRHFDVLHIGHLRIPTVHYSEGKMMDDSNIIFRYNLTNAFGRITSIFYLTIDHPFLLVDYPQETTAIRCRISADDTEIQYEHVRHGDMSRKQACLIDITDFIETCAYLQTTTNDCFVSRFPTLTHSS